MKLLEIVQSLRRRPSQHSAAEPMQQPFGVATPESALEPCTFWLVGSGAIEVLDPGQFEQASFLEALQAAAISVSSEATVGYSFGPAMRRYDLATNHGTIHICEQYEGVDSGVLIHADDPKFQNEIYLALLKSPQFVERKHPALRT